MRWLAGFDADEQISHSSSWETLTFIPMRSATPVKLPDAGGMLPSLPMRQYLYQCGGLHCYKRARRAHDEICGEDWVTTQKMLLTDGYFFSKFFIADGKNTNG